VRDSSPKQPALKPAPDANLIGTIPRFANGTAFIIDEYSVTRAIAEKSGLAGLCRYGGDRTARFAQKRRMGLTHLPLSESSIARLMSLKG
jgi:hypothetical protein